MRSPINASDLRVNAQRLKDEILTFAEIGKNKEDHGIYRMAFTDADMEARELLKQKFMELGAAVRMDGAGNVIGHWPPELATPSVVIGSHLDTVPGGGHLDGSLGVLVGLECLRVLVENNFRLRWPLEVIAFSDEEGRFGGMFGSQAFTGQISPETVYTSIDLNGELLSDAMEKQGLPPTEALSAQREPGTVRHYLELHIEQGPVLQNLNRQVGIVEEITGLFRWTIRLKGKANHAGTTPMDMRHDTLSGLAEFANEIPRILEENGSERSRATIGSVNLWPGAANTIPGQAEFSLDVRDTEEGKLRELQEAFRKALSAIARRRALMFEFDEVSWIDPVACSDKVVKILQDEAKTLGLKSQQMPSGAAHDAQIIASIAPVGMIFVPSKEGRSHSPAEWTSWQDIEAGANLALHALMKLLIENDQEEK